MERNKRKTLQGRVTSDKMNKTITVEIETIKKHPLYGKKIISTMKVKAHDGSETAKTGDLVKIMETRPLSATKRFRLVDIVERGEE